MTETRDGISLIARGQADVRSLGFGPDGLVSNSDFAFHTGSGMVRVGNPKSTRARSFFKISGPTSFGSNEEGREVSGTGDVVGVLPRRGLLVMPADYQSGEQVFGTVDYPCISLEDLGIQIGVYRCSWGERLDGDSLVVRVDSDIREPATDRPKNLLQNGSFEFGLHPWVSEPRAIPRHGEGRHGESYLNLSELRFAEQVLNLFPGT